ncbi:MAG TPA: hypothetical protein VL961_03795 [Acidimicrobiales bacterium]|nr:hypothetical protein [Acidimicrobiales bacterium]
MPNRPGGHTSVSIAGLFDDDEGTRLWASTNGIGWRQIALPHPMTALDVTAVVFGHGRFEAVLDNRYAGGPNTAYGESDQVWSSRGGSRWRQGGVPGSTARFDFLAATSRGFVLGGTLRPNGAPTKWVTENGTAWQRS